MKIWNCYGSEHSMNLVMIGRFNKVEDAVRAKEIIERLAEQVRSDERDGRIKLGSPIMRYPDGILDLLGKMDIGSIGSKEVEQFAYDFKIKTEGEMVVITTEEADVSAFFKVLIENEARVEIYSAHDNSDTEYGRGK